jgi:hypothetical protein
MTAAKPYGQLQYKQIRGKRMAYLDEGVGNPIVFAHGNPTSSYLWRNVMPHLEGLGRLVACDLIGMGASDKLSPSGPDRYHYAEQRDFLFELWDGLDLGDRVVLVLHDWGSALWRPPRDVVQESDNTVCDVLTVGNDELRLIVYTALRRSETADRIQQSGAAGRPAAKASRSSTPDHTEPIHLVNQRRRMC